MSISFLLTSLAIVATPGTGALYTVAAGLSRGTRASIVAAVGCTLGIVPHMIAAITGLAALLNASAAAFQTIKYAGVAYLLYMAWGTLKDKGVLAVEEDAPALPAMKVIRTGIAINLLNPKLTIFFFAFLPQFVNTKQPNAWLPMSELSGVFMAMTFAVFVLYGRFAAAFRDKVVARPAVVTGMRRAFAGAFAALAAVLAFEI
ncbi:LysE family translocator [Kitasatospora viridis]|uniref:Threonine/homoserine/homoserine lactone efflux protein n=1 Tax=Kitasatospora viridis TaxID=281105 RepID=A0A561UCC1_9ACTN|nr:LysE family translocator [Kitasatospora viridis]TWF97008.1 threonine/homoserine/homoserine lactone efflux protein [Kitasatospora viridis]